jgi:hypothetical protein
MHMGRLRVRISDGTVDQVRGSLEDVARVELEIAPFGLPALLRLRNLKGALVAQASLVCGRRVEVRSAPWLEWPARAAPVDRLSLSAKAGVATVPQLRVELTEVDQLVVTMPAAAKDPWEVIVIAGNSQRVGLNIQSIFSISAP